MADALHKPIEPGTHVLVVGLGKTGLAALHFFAGLGARVSISDAGPANSIPHGVAENVAETGGILETGRHSTDLFTAVDLVVVSPGVPLDLEPLQAARARNIPVIGELAVAAVYLKSPVVAVTGTNGKTTVTTMLGDIFKNAGKKVFVGGNIGTPIFDYLAGPQDADIVVLEISSFQIDTGGGRDGFRPTIGLLLNITPDHLDRYESFQEYVSSKFSLFAAQRPEDTAIMNSDDPIIMDNQELWPTGNCYFVGGSKGRPGALLQDDRIILHDIFKNASQNADPEEYDLSATELGRSPYLENSAAAMLAARLMGISGQDIMNGIGKFVPLSHRLTLVAEIRGVTYYDDSKATNIGAVRSALAGMQQPVILIAGGRDKGGGYDMLTELVREKVKTVLLIGEAADAMRQAFASLTMTEKAADLVAAVNRAAQLAVAGDAVLLSPACASFDMFTSYAHRGDVFRSAVQDLKEREQDN